MQTSQLLDLINRSNGEVRLTKRRGLSIENIREIEKKLGIELPEELLQFYSISNGIQGDHWLFNIIPFDEVTKDIDHEGEYIVFAEYMIYSETCGLEIDPSNKNNYKIFNDRSASSQKIIRRKYVANSILDFIKLYLQEGTFGIWTDD